MWYLREKNQTKKWASHIITPFLPGTRASFILDLWRREPSPSFPRGMGQPRRSIAILCISTVQAWTSRAYSAPRWSFSHLLLLQAPHPWPLPTLVPRRMASEKGRHTKVFLREDNINGKLREESPGDLGAVTTSTGKEDLCQGPGCEHSHELSLCAKVNWMGKKRVSRRQSLCLAAVLSAPGEGGPPLSSRNLHNYPEPMTLPGFPT